MKGSTYHHPRSATATKPRLLRGSIHLLLAALLLALVPFVPSFPAAQAAGTIIRVTPNGAPIIDLDTSEQQGKTTSTSPSFTSTPVNTASEDTLYTYDITTTDEDSSAQQLTITAPTLPDWLTLTDFADGTALLDGFPSTNDVGQQHSVVLLVTDEAGNSAMQEFSITVNNVNNPPSFTSVPPLNAVEGQEYQYAITATDPDSDTLTITAPILPDWLMLTDAGDGTATLSGTPGSGDEGISLVKLDVSDNAGYSEIQTFEISVAAANRGDGEFLEEQEPNNTLANADPLVAENGEQTSIQGTISTARDADWFAINAYAGDIVDITLSNLPASYNVALIGNPDDTHSADKPAAKDERSDLRHVGDRGHIDEHGRISSYSDTSDITRINTIGGTDVTNHLLGVAGGEGTTNRELSIELPDGGTYYILVYSAHGKSDVTQEYTLNVTIEPNADATWQNSSDNTITSLNVTTDTSITTLFIYDSAHMRKRYPRQTQTIRQLDELLRPNTWLMQHTNAASIDLVGPALTEDDRNVLHDLRRALDEHPTDVPRANEIASFIKSGIDLAITTYYPSTVNLVLVGGDTIIPFYRVSDETAFFNQSVYYTLLNTSGNLNDETLLAASLRGSYILTDNYYADSEPTPWRGRYLYMPDMAVGRLVETPQHIFDYLTSYSTGDASAREAGSFVIDTTTTEPQHSGAVLVTGYSFLQDTANTLAGLYETFGFDQRGSLGSSYTLVMLNNDVWRVADFVDRFFSGQIDQLTHDPPYEGIYSRYHLMHINGHFSHYHLEDTDGDTFQAAQLIQPRPARIEDVYFKNNGLPTLIYATGCHAGLNVLDEDIAENAPEVRADFPSAVLKQGGNWIGPTSYSYGDAFQLGYTEELAWRFAQVLGTNINTSAYRGMSIGQALLQAKQQYLQNVGPGGLNVYDEKVLLATTLYGLPFIRVKVPNPQPYVAPETLPVPDGAIASDGSITRIITITNRFGDSDATLLDMTSVVEDSFKPGETTSIASEMQLYPGRATLPALTYNIALQASTETSADQQPQPRGVRLLAATSLPIVNDYEPHVTRLITEEVYTGLTESPDMEIQQTWLPELPYTFQRIYSNLRSIDIGCTPPPPCLQNSTAQSAANQGIITDKITFTPAQFKATSSTQGELRRFTQMVFAITYLDPATVSPDGINCRSCGPGFSTWALGAETLTIEEITESLLLQQTTFHTVTLAAEILNPNGSDIQEVSATFTADGETWHYVPLTQQAVLSYTASLSVESVGNEVFAFFELRDQAGNVAVESIDFPWEPFNIPPEPEEYSVYLGVVMK
jgi:hypothetical protein